jgi:hypothetical protein
MEDRGTDRLKRLADRAGSIAGAAAALSLLRGAEKQHRETESPGIVRLDDRSNAVFERAEELAAEGREDRAAVAELIALADGNLETLRNAERASRLGGLHHESSEDNLVYRLLQATISGGPVGPATPDQAERFRLLDSFAEKPVAQQWAQLIARQPSLAEVDGDVRAGRLGDSRRTRSSELPRNEEQRRAYAEQIRDQSRLDARLSQLVGPECGQDDALLSSQVAYEAARSYLTRAAD